MPRLVVEIVALVALASCGRVGFDPLGNGGMITDAPFADSPYAGANRIFVTRATTTGALGGYAGADAFCAAAAAGAALEGDFVALLFDGTTELRPGLLDGSTGWVDLAQRPIARVPDDFRNAATLYPIQYDERGVPVEGSAQMLLGRNGGTCSGFTSEISNEGVIITLADRGMFGSIPFNGTCERQHHLLCAERGRTASVAAPVETGRLAFVSDRAFAPGGGLAAADALCNADAAAAQLPGTYRAWLGTSAGGPETRFVPSGEPWRRVDGPRLAPTAADVLTLTSSAYLTTFLNRTAANQVVTTLTWVGDMASNCVDWTSSGPVMGMTGNPTVTLVGEWRSYFMFPCDTAFRITCLQL